MALHLLIKENQIKLPFAPHPQHVSDETEGAAPVFFSPGPSEQRSFPDTKATRHPSDSTFLLQHPCYQLRADGQPCPSSLADCIPCLVVHLPPAGWAGVHRGPLLSCWATSQHLEAPCCDGWGSHTGRWRVPWDLIL